MPFPRFQKLPPEKRERLMEVAAAESFGPTFAELHRQPLLRSFQQPWLFAAVRAAEHLSPAALQREPLTTFARQIKTWTMNIVKRGQELGVIRTDMPEDLIFAWLQGLDDASDHWLLAHWQHLDRETIAQISDQTVEAMCRTLASIPEARGK